GGILGRDGECPQAGRLPGSERSDQPRVDAARQQDTNWNVGHEAATHGSAKRSLHTLLPFRVAEVALRMEEVGLPVDYVLPDASSVDRERATWQQLLHTDPDAMG